MNLGQIIKQKLLWLYLEATMVVVPSQEECRKNSVSAKIPATPLVLVTYYSEAAKKTQEDKVKPVADATRPVPL